MARIGGRRASKVEGWILMNRCDCRTQIAILREVRMSSRMFIVVKR
jgi:hypothetical protein